MSKCRHGKCHNLTDFMFNIIWNAVKVWVMETINPDIFRYTVNVFKLTLTVVYEKVLLLFIESVFFLLFAGMSY